MPEGSYKAFISYSHTADSHLAESLQEALQLLAKPWYRKRAFPIFRDQTDLSVSPHLWASIEEALDRSDYFILLASPQAACSMWIDKEITYWLKHKGIDSLILVLTDGQLVWDEERGAFDPELSNALPSVLLDRHAGVPLYVDLSSFKGPEQISISNSAFAEAIHPLAAELHDKSVQELFGEIEKNHRRALLLRNAAIASLAALLAIAVVAGLNFLEQKKIAESRLLAIRAEDAAEDGEHHLSLLLARASMDRHPTLDGDRALRTAMGMVPEPLGRVSHSVDRPYTVDTISFSPSGKYWVTASGATVTSGGHTKVWHTDDMKPLAIDVGAPGPAYFSPVEDLLVVGSDSHEMRLIEIPSGKIRRSVTFDRRVVVVLAISPNGRYCVTHNYDDGERRGVQDNDTLDVIDLLTGQKFATVSPTSTTGYSWGQAFFFERGDQTYLAARWSQSETDEWRFTDSGLEYRSVQGALSLNGKWILFSSESTPGFRVVLESDPAHVVVEDEETTVRDFRFSPHGDLLALSDSDQRLFVYNLASGDGLTAGNIRQSADNILFSPDGHYLASKRSALVWNARTGEVIAENFASEQEVASQSKNFRQITEQYVGQARRTKPAFGLAFGPDSESFYTHDNVGQIYIWKSDATSHVIKVNSKNQLYGAEVAPDGRNILAAAYGSLSEWDFQNLEVKHESERPVWTVAYDESGHRYAYATGVDIVSEEPAGLHIATPIGKPAFYPFKSRIVAMDFHRDGKQLALAANATISGGKPNDAGVSIVNLESGKREFIVESGLSHYDVKFHPTRPWLAFASGFGSKIVDLPPRKEILSTSWAENIEFNANGRLVALHNRENVWVMELDDDLGEQTFKEVSRLVIDARPSSVAFDPTGHYLAVGTHFKGVGVWLWRQRREVVRIPARSKVVSAEFIPNDPRLVAVVEEHRMTLNYWRAEDMLVQSEPRALRELSSTELLWYLGDTPE